jgi:phosphatidylglycerophosphate synthase
LLAVAVAALSDLADGAASRLLHAQSEFGQLLDPVADKVFVVGVVAALLADGSLAWWQAGLVALRDIAVLAGALWLVLRRGWPACRGMRPRWPGKVTTALQFAFLLAVLLGESTMITVLLVVTALASGWAAADYGQASFRRNGRNPTGLPDTRAAPLNKPFPYSPLSWWEREKGSRNRF